MRDAPTPSMQQYLKAKADHPDCIVLFRMGDFYETFFEDAVEASQILDIALTSRNRDDPDPVPMAGVPWHAANQYIARLLAAGKKVAVCEQLEDPKQAKGLVRREVVRVITPGVLLDTEMPDPSGVHHLVCVVPAEAGFALAALDASTGVLQGAMVRSQEDLARVLARLTVREALLPERTSDQVKQVVAGEGALITPLDPADLDRPDPDEPRVLGRVDSTPVPLQSAVRGILSYLRRTWPALLQTVQPLVALPVRDTMLLPASTIRNLEFVQTTAQGQRKGSLLFHLDRTCTAMGSRLLRSYLLAPLLDLDEIERRLDLIEILVQKPTVRAAVRSALEGVPDIERTLTRLAGGAASARDLLALARAVRAAQTCAADVAALDSRELHALTEVPPELGELAQRIENTFVPDPPAVVREGGMLRRGVNPALDEARAMAEDGRRFLAEYEARERERTGIQTLRIRYNRVFGYAIEVTRSFLPKVPADYQRRQTLANAERFVTEELSRLEQQISGADERSREIEYQVFEEFRAAVLDAGAKFQELASRVARLDAMAALAEVSHTRGYCRPKLNRGRGIRIVAGRHPIVEAALPPGSFVPNDYELDGQEVTLDILTGPNMAGKSTVMRQVALIVVMAQMGCFVPADEAEIGLVDALFTRVGAMDDLAAGRSTFMVEMSEAAEILARATDQSLVILDEIGRGTATYDGVAIAWAMAEYILEHLRCRTLFATHYHELTDLARAWPRVRNLNITVQEWGGQILFLRKLAPGPANKSYGIQVARLAGLPDEVIARAREVLANLEAGEWDALGRPVLARSRRRKSPPVTGQLDLFASLNAAEPDPLVRRIAGLDPNRLTPLEALQRLSDLVEEARRKVGT